MGDKFLFPPWLNDGWTTEWTEGIGTTDAYVDVDEYNGDAYAYVGALGVGKAETSCTFYHLTHEDQYYTKESGLHDFKFTYSYEGSLDANVFIFYPSDASLIDEIKINFEVVVYTNPPEIYDKEIVLDEETRKEDDFVDWDNTEEVYFKDINIPKDTRVSFKAWIYIWVYAASGLLSGAEGTVNLFGSMDQIKIIEPNSAPDKPCKPSGKTTGDKEKTYTYKSSTADPDGDDVYYWFDWGDGTNSGWIGPYNSGDTSSASHTWDEGYYEIKVKAKDTNGAVSVWSDPLSISMPRNRAVSSFFMRLLNRFQFY